MAAGSWFGGLALQQQQQQGVTVAAHQPSPQQTAGAVRQPQLESTDQAVQILVRTLLASLQPSDTLPTEKKTGRS